MSNFSAVAATHTDPNPTPMLSSGFAPSAIRAITLLLAGSMRSSALLLIFDNHTEP